jgi:hypothetical protein
MLQIEVCFALILLSEMAEMHNPDWMKAFLVTAGLCM